MAPRKKTTKKSKKTPVMILADKIGECKALIVEQREVVATCKAKVEIAEGFLVEFTAELTTLKAEQEAERIKEPKAV